MFCSFTACCIFEANCNFFLIPTNLLLNFSPLNPGRSPPVSVISYQISAFPAVAGFRRVRSTVYSGLMSVIFTRRSPLANGRRRGDTAPAGVAIKNSLSF